MMSPKFIFTEQSTGVQFIVEAPKKMTIDDFHQALQQKVIIKFVKKSNDRVRYIYCTRNPEIIKQIGMGSKLPGPDSQGYLGPDEVIPVFDLIKKDWRSFDVRTVRDVRRRTLNTVDRIFRRNRYDRDFDRSDRAITTLGQRRDKQGNAKFEESENVTEFFAIEMTSRKISSFTEFLTESR